MIRPETLRTLEFDKILQVIAARANSEVTCHAVGDISPMTDKEGIEARFGLVEEIRRLSRQGTPLRLAPFNDISPILKEARPQGAVLDPLDLAGLTPLLQIISAVAAQLAYRDDIPLLKALAVDVTGFPEILDNLVCSLDGEGNILDTASRLLMDLRKRKRSLDQRIRKRLEEIVRERQTAIFLQDDFITQRSGRWVIPVRMDSKGMVPGVVHDVSRSGETAFMEPIEIIGLANELENLIAEVKSEEIRILRHICSLIREEADDMEAQFRIIVQLDLLNCIAGFSEDIGASVPVMGDGPPLLMRSARHPILLLLQKERGGSAVVPLDLSLGTDAPVMVITGPNAGGKTIAIKTAGLLLLMALSGIPVPAAPSSVFPMATGLLADIGDEQSIEESLSTFSAHVSRIARIVEGADARTVVLLDELGTGTEPLQGAAIACAVLKELHEKGALVLATTHLTDIAGYVHRTPGMVNASMEFDSRTFAPSYRLRSGEPGQSHAIETARRYGLPERIIDSAKGLLGRMDTEFHSLLAELKEKNRQTEESLEALSRRERELAAREAELSLRLSEAEKEKRGAKEKGLLEAREIIRAAKAEARGVLDEVRREKRREPVKRLEEAEKLVEEELRAFSTEPSLPLERITEGATVFVRTLGCDAVVRKIDPGRKRLRVQARGMEIEVPASDVGPKSGKSPKAEPSRRKMSAEPEAEAAYEINLIGFRVDDALARLEPFLNHAALAQLGEVRIVHGKGAGVLMRAIREYLEGHPLVGSFRKGEQFEGGEGATVATLR